MKAIPLAQRRRFIGASTTTSGLWQNPGGTPEDDGTTHESTLGTITVYNTPRPIWPVLLILGVIILSNRKSR